MRGPSSPVGGREPSLLVILSGPSGVGKDAVLARMRELDLPFHYVVTVTTRPQRYGEVDGQDYFFVTQQEFMEMKDGSKLLEWAKVYGNYYGVPRDQVRKALEQGMDVIAKLDVQGASTMRRLVSQSVGIFLAPPSMEELRNRLRHRKTEQGRDFEIRVNRAREEMQALPIFDYVVVNDDLEKAVGQIQAIITAEKCRVVPRQAEL
ncbi:MAG: guanylate kinase [Dehalococcoidia bacterium]|nr:guanylate kinase [Dehalococcoidia bacterium]